MNISQPIKIESGSSILNIPGLRDENGDFTYSSKKVSLVPSARELNYDFGYEKYLSSQSSLRLGTQFKINPHHSSYNQNSMLIYGIYGVRF